MASTPGNRQRCSVTVTDTKTNQYWTGSANAGPEDLISYTMDITYTGTVVGVPADSGTIVTNQTPPIPVHAGWPIQLGVTNVAPADLSTTFTWSIDGAGGNGSAAINGYVRDNLGEPVVPGRYYDAASVAALTPGNDSTPTFPDPSSPGILKRYYYTKAGAFTASVQPQGGNIPSVKTTFSVAEPTNTLTAKYQFPAGSGAAGGFEYILLRAANAAGLSPVQLNWPQVGILFTHPPTNGSAFGGHSYFVQVYAADQHYTGIGNIQSRKDVKTGLDVQDPYSKNFHDAKGSDFTGDGPEMPTDRWPNTVNYSPVTVNDLPKMWVMYTPASAGSIAIPLARSSWNWGGKLTWNAATKTWGALADASPAAAGPAPASATYEYPTWSIVYNPPVLPQ